MEHDLKDLGSSLRDHLNSVFLNQTRGCKVLTYLLAGSSAQGRA